MYETIRIVEKLKPKYVIWENVKNLLSKKHKHNFDSYLEIMESLGYKNYYQVLNAKDYGIPQNRERVFTISIREDIDKEFIFPEKQELKLRLKDMLEDEVDEKYYLSDDKIDKISHWKGFQKPFEKVQGKNSIVPTLTARGAGEEHNGMITFSDNLENTTNLQEQCLNIKSGANNLGVCVLGNYMPSGHESSRIIDNKGIAPTIKENHGTVNATQTNDLRIRKLTPKECWRLMGFDDEDFDKASKVNSNSQLYKQAGNSIVVNVLESILKNLLKEN
jgi:DNA (cytosine-5)-methyltransferase 1